MKLGICLSTFQSNFGAIVFSTKDFKGNLNTICELGYDGVDLFTHKLNDSEIFEINSFLKNVRLKISLLAAIWLTEKGSYITDYDKDRRAQAIKRYKSQIEVASKFGAENMPIGYSRGNQKETETEESYQRRLAESLKELSECADSKGVNLLIEPINRYEINTLNRVDQALEFISKYKLNSIKLLLDTYHMNIEERSIEKAIEISGSLIRHIHVADNNRLAPGEGHLNFDSIIRSISKTGYNGFLTVEALPIPSAYECAKSGIKFLRDEIVKYKK